MRRPPPKGVLHSGQLLTADWVGLPPVEVGCRVLLPFRREAELETDCRCEANDESNTATITKAIKPANQIMSVIVVAE